MAPLVFRNSMWELKAMDAMAEDSCHEPIAPRHRASKNHPVKRLGLKLGVYAFLGLS